MDLNTFINDVILGQSLPRQAHAHDSDGQKAVSSDVLSSLHVPGVAEGDGGLRAHGAVVLAKVGNNI